MTSTTDTPFTTLPDEATLAATVLALEEHGFAVEVVDDLDSARTATLRRIPRGATVMTNTSVTLQETGIDEAINGADTYDSARNRMLALDYATQGQEMKASPGRPTTRSAASPPSPATAPLSSSPRPAASSPPPIRPRPGRIAPRVRGQLGDPCRGHRRVPDSRATLTSHPVAITRACSASRGGS